MRELLLDVAGKAFSAKGFSVATMDSIAVEAGVATSVLYRNFPTKQALFREVTLQPFLHFLNEYRSTWTRQRRKPWDERKLMRAMLGEFYDSVRAHRHGVIGIASMDNLLDRDTVAEMDSQLQSVFAEMLLIGEDESVRRGWFPKKSLDLSIRLVLGMVAASAVLDSVFLPTGKRRPSRKQVIDHLAALALYGLSLQPPISVVKRATAKGSGKAPS